MVTIAVLRLNSGTPLLTLRRTIGSVQGKRSFEILSVSPLRLAGKHRA
jgi:hypothetical protein